MFFKTKKEIKVFDILFCLISRYFYNHLGQYF